MTLKYYPNQGEILLCNYGRDVVPPEMGKLRPIVVISPRLRRRENLVCIVPLSTTAPDVVEAFHCQIELSNPLPPPFDRPIMWAKCDMIATVSKDRLDRFKAGRKANGGARLYVAGKLTDDQLRDIKAAVLCGLGLSALTAHL
jgi:mRNA interferase MazF